VRITRDHGTLYATATRTADCAACGTRIRGERTFANAIQTALPDGTDLALAVLLDRVARWKDEPAVCRQCPGQIPVRVRMRGGVA
jgi:hypothetical protein